MRIQGMIQAIVGGLASTMEKAEGALRIGARRNPGPTHAHMVSECVERQWFCLKAFLVLMQVAEGNLYQTGSEKVAGSGSFAFSVQDDGVAYRLKLATLIAPEPIGTILVASEGHAVVALDFDTPDGRLRQMLRPRYGDDIAFDETDGPPKVMAALRAYFDGDVRAIDSVPVEAGGTPFQREVWTALRKIPPGETRSYGTIAAALGRPAAARAVGRANGLNPVSLVVPCHRLVGADAALTGYGGGLARKRWLLDHEQRYR